MRNALCCVGCSGAPRENETRHYIYGAQLHFVFVIVLALTQQVDGKVMGPQATDG